MARKGIFSFDEDLGLKRENIVLFIFPIAALLILTIVIPADMFSTALWYDQRGMNMVFGGTIGTESGRVLNLLGGLVPGEASIEGVVFSALLNIAQLLATWKVFTVGNWTRNGQDPGFFTVVKRFLKAELPPENVNWIRFGWLFFWLFCVLFDAMTGIEYRANAELAAQTAAAAGAAGAAVITGQQYFQIVVISIFYENIFSEIAFGETIRGTVILVIALANTLPQLLGRYRVWRAGVSRSTGGSSMAQVATQRPREQREQRNQPPPPQQRGQRPQTPPPPDVPDDVLAAMRGAPRPPVNNMAS